MTFNSSANDSSSIKQGILLFRYEDNKYYAIEMNSTQVDIDSILLMFKFNKKI